ncbi:MAG: hypothetical protein A4E52_00454 [Pelotomaculum sp. PtaB.Bin013]|uniref:DUF881 domain-containing protein n=1 Tax=Pelotomaculum isophthalicicum JI TaxID=947010 RepID=A0A9X4GZ57_9FIRM|nr:DUF881 domain-containing protein [Pelotomaculum isophthalicicum]MDF9408392.1 DUF881 domain-containing protein [Pelotomaculum isophthalicicum JI]OPX91558.1 MAG: hypothetical protein A4E52_00454 [Pelotomaculum sp. PtaB.Bin013]
MKSKIERSERGFNLNKVFFLSISFVAVLSGVLLGYQFRATSAGNIVVPRDREQELALEKKSLVEDLHELQVEISDLSVKLEQAGIGQSEANEAMERELARIRRFAGLAPVSGPGVELVAQIRPEQDGSGTAYELKDIADQHLLTIVNELNKAGAEAIAINGQRITPISEIRLAGNHINVNGTPISPPYHIIAIGNASALKSRLELKGGLAESLLSNYGISVETQEKNEVVIPAFAGELNFEYAKPVKEN